MLLIGKPSINGPFSIAMLNNQRVVPPLEGHKTQVSKALLLHCALVPCRKIPTSKAPAPGTMASRATKSVHSKQKLQGSH